MNILVMDVAASTSGPLSILENYYHIFQGKKENIYYFCISTPELQPCQNIQILQYSWVKKSWLHRIWFELFVAPRLAHRHHIDEVLSLQNIVMQGTKVPQTLYIHTLLPFSEYRFSLWKDPKLWIYQNLIAKMIFVSAKKADKIIIQTEWMKRSLMHKTGICGSKVSVIQPELTEIEFFSFDKNLFENTFFYPAVPETYKNHETLFRAIDLLIKSGETKFRVLLTLTYKQLPKRLRPIYEKTKDHIVLLGVIPRTDVMRQYTKSILVYPSYLESYGLPLHEAKLAQTPILAADCAYAKEVLSGYKHVSYFDPFDEQKLCALMLTAIVRSKEEETMALSGKEECS